MTPGPVILSELDTFFYAAETPSQHLHVLATLLLDRSAIPGRGGYELFQSRVEERFKLIEPLRRRLVAGLVGRPFWIDDPAVHLRRHLHHVVLPEGGGLDALAEVASEIASYPLPKDRPLWEAWFVEGFEKDHMAVVAKIHHSAVDGVSGIFALAAFFDLEPFPETYDTTEWEQPVVPSTAQLVSAAVEELRHRPAAVLRGLKRVATSTAILTRSRGPGSPLPCTGPRMSYNRALTPRRSVAFTTLKLDEVKQVGRSSGASVNDVVVALCAGVLRRYAILCDELPDRPLVAAVPVSERLPEHGTAGNRLSFMFYGLPVHLGDPVERLAFVTHSSSAAKDVHGRAGQGLMAALATLVPQSTIGPVMRLVSSSHAANVVPPIANVLISNIKGPELPLYVAGASLGAIFPMGPIMEGVGLGVTAVSYHDEMAFGFMACTDLVADVRDFSTGLHLEMSTMLDAFPAPTPKRRSPPSSP
jgi:diacylglycerol O-acyltransferase / wax synthase